MNNFQIAANFSRWSVRVVLLVTFLILVALACICHFNSVEEAPTCISFNASGTLDVRDKVLAALPGVIESAGMKLRAERDGSKFWQSSNVTVTVYLGGKSGGYTIFVCQKRRYEAHWQEVARKIEQLLPSNEVAAWLQRNNRDFNCDPNCTTSLPLPIDFELLNRTMLAHGPGL